jgi:transposase InsO family protein
MRYAFLEQHGPTWPIRTMCRVLQVRPSGYYRWRDRAPSRRQVQRLRLVESIRSVHQRSGGRYGSPRVHQALCKEGTHCSRNHVARLMRENQLRASRSRRFRIRTTDSRHAFPLAENRLNRQFHPSKLDTVWVADLTYVATDEGWLYVATVMDLCSRRIIGWSAAEHLRAELPLCALEQALADRRPSGELMHHSDRGVQYACGDYQAVLEREGIQCSMSRSGNCYDNAAMESFFKTFKVELVYQQRYPTREEARASIYNYIELFYNRQRLHSALGYQSPVEYEACLR